MDAVRCRAGQIPNKKVLGEVVFFEPEQSVFDRALALFDELRTEFGVEGQTTQMSDVEWLKTQRRVRDLEKALDENRANPLPPMENAAFVKSEKKGLFKVTDMFQTNPLDEAKPRLIQGYPDAWLAYVGPYVKTVQHRIEEMFSMKGPLAYAGAAKPEELCAWLQENAAFADTHFYICIDYKMFDSTHSKMSFEFVEAIYRRLVVPTDREDVRVSEALEQMRWPEGKLCGNLRYKSGKFMNGSGRPDTSLLNIVNSMFALILSITSVLSGKPIPELLVSDVRGALEASRVVASGDDSVCVVPKVYRGRVFTEDDWKVMAARIGQFGFIAEVEPSPTFTHMVFLGQRAYPVQGKGGRVEWYWGPTIGRRIVKHHHLHHCTGDPVAVLHGICDMEYICYRHVPVLSDMAAVCLKILRGHKFTHFCDPDAQYKTQFEGPVMQSRVDRSHCANDRAKTPRYDALTMLHLSDVYECAVEDLQDLIDYIGSIENLPTIVNHPMLTKICTYDNR
jgi:hypothetical protein